ncbi:MAG: hypothetical protein Q8R12_01250, partial [bacterium]|nr:hypothetical protein [bacterium]
MLEDPQIKLLAERPPEKIRIEDEQTRVLLKGFLLDVSNGTILTPEKLDEIKNILEMLGVETKGAKGQNSVGKIIQEKVDVGAPPAASTESGEPSATDSSSEALPSEDLAKAEAARKAKEKPSTIEISPVLNSKDRRQKKPKIKVGAHVGYRDEKWEIELDHKNGKVTLLRKEDGKLRRKVIDASMLEIISPRTGKKSEGGEDKDGVAEPLISNVPPAEELPEAPKEIKTLKDFIEHYQDPEKQRAQKEKKAEGEKEVKKSAKEEEGERQERERRKAEAEKKREKLEAAYTRYRNVEKSKTIDATGGIERQEYEKLLGSIRQEIVLLELELFLRERDKEKQADQIKLLSEEERKKYLEVARGIQSPIIMEGIEELEVRVAHARADKKISEQREDATGKEAFEKEEAATNRVLQLREAIGKEIPDKEVEGRYALILALRKDAKTWRAGQEGFESREYEKAIERMEHELARRELEDMLRQNGKKDLADKLWTITKEGEEELFNLSIIGSAVTKSASELERSIAVLKVQKKISEMNGDENRVKAFEENIEAHERILREKQGEGERQEEEIVKSGSNWLSRKREQAKNFGKGFAGFAKTERMGILIKATYDTISTIIGLKALGDTALFFTKRGDLYEYAQTRKEKKEMRGVVEGLAEYARQKKAEAPSGAKQKMREARDAWFVLEKKVKEEGENATEEEKIKLEEAEKAYKEALEAVKGEAASRERRPEVVSIREILAKEKEVRLKLLEEARKSGLDVDSPEVIKKLKEGQEWKDAVRARKEAMAQPSVRVKAAEDFTNKLEVALKDRKISADE